MGRRGPHSNTEHLYRRGRIWWCWYYSVDGALIRRSTGSTDKAAARSRLSQWERTAADPDAPQDQTLNDCLQSLVDERRVTTGEHNVSFLQGKTRCLVTVFGHDLPISRFRDATLSWQYIDERRKMHVGKRVISDRCIKRELGILKSALAVAKSRGFWAGDPDVIVPPDFSPAPAPKGDSISREQALRLFPRLTPDSAAAMAFCLATGAEMSALRNAKKSDLPDDLAACRAVLVRGTKNGNRHAVVPIVTDEQRVLLEYVRKYAHGSGEKLFGNLHRLLRELAEACGAEHITVVSPHDIRRSAGQWMVDLGVPIELVSKFMRHADTRITETVYAEVKRADVADRILDALDPRYARTAHRGRTKPVVNVLKKLPAPKCTFETYVVNGATRTLAAWAREAGIAKTTLHHRVVTRGMSMADALAMGRANYRRSVDSARTAPDCETGVQVSSDQVASNEQRGQISPSSSRRFSKKTPQIQYARQESNLRHSASKAEPISSNFFLVRSSTGSNRDQTPTPLELARMLRADAAHLPRVRAVLIEELALAVLSSNVVQLAVAVIQEQNPDARLTTALRLCDALEPTTHLPPLTQVTEDGRK